MKKMIYILLCIICLSGCAGEYKGWKEIEMADLGTIKIPEGWVCHIQDNKIYFTDKDVKEFTEDTVHLAGYIYDEGKNPGENHNMFNKEVIWVERTESEVFSNNTFRGKDKYIIDNEICEKAYIILNITKDKEISMIAWDENVSYDDIKKMAKSFCRYSENEK